MGLLDGVSPAPISPDAFFKRTQQFLEWLSAASATVSPKLALKDYRNEGAGRGVEAVVDVGLDESLFSIPRKLVLDTQNSALHQLLDISLDDIGHWNALILVMLYEFLQKEESRWHPYFLILPNEFNTLMFWSPTELAELQGSAIVPKVGKADADKAILRDIAPVVRANPVLFPPPNNSWIDVSGEQDLLHLAHVMSSLVMAYAFDIEKEEEVEEDDDGVEQSEEEGYVTDQEDDPPKGMIPLADMLNADGDLNNARVFQENDSLVMKAIKPIKAGDQIYNDYGPLPRSDLLRRYGYVSERYSQFDVVEFSLQSLCEEAGFQSAKPGPHQPRLQYLMKHDALEDGYVVTHPSTSSTILDALPEDLKVVLHTICMSDTTWLCLQKSQRTPKPRFGQMEAIFMQRVVQRRQADYASSLEEDQELLNGTRAKRKPQGNQIGTVEDRRLKRLEMAIEVRMGEKAILHKLLSMLAAFTNEQAQVEVEAGSRFKRPRLS